MFNPDDLIEHLNARPFQAIELQLSSGERYRIAHPEQAMVTTTDAVIIATSTDDRGRHEVRWVGLDHIVSFAPITSEAP